MTQNWKRQRLEDCGIAVPNSARYVAADLSVKPLREALNESGFDPNAPAFFAWLGVTPYLAPTSVLSTLGAIDDLTKPGGGVVFDYLLPRSLVGARERASLAIVSILVGISGEPFRAFFAPDTLAETLRQIGFRDVQNFGPNELNPMYFMNRTDGLQIGQAGHIMKAIN